MMAKMTSADSTPHLSVIIPTRNNERDLSDCIASIMNLDYDLNKIEIIIWDNNSVQESKNNVKDSLYRLVKKKTARSAFIENHHNLGAFNSRDELLKLISKDAQYVLSIDDDVILPPELLKESLPVFAEDNCVGIIGPRTVYENAALETAHGAGFINWWSGCYCTKDSSKPLECDYVIGCCMIIKKSVIDEIGGFDHDFYTSHAEVDFCVRAGEKNYKILYYPYITVQHRVDRGGTKSLNRIYYVYRNKLFIIKKNAPFPQKWISLGLYLLFWLPKSILDSIIRNRRPDLQEIKTILKAMMDGWLSRGGKRA